MAFTRAFLKEHGVPEEEIDNIMAERNRTLNEYVSKSDVQAQIDAAMKDYVPKADVEKQINEVKATIKPVTESDEYKAIAAELAMNKAINGEDYAAVKPKFRETVYRMLDHGEKAKPLAEQLKGVQEKYEEYFTPAQNNNSYSPVFGSKDSGGMPSGNGGDSFAKAWGYVKGKE
jgi:hypothetical protein